MRSTKRSINSSSRKTPNPEKSSKPITSTNKMWRGFKWAVGLTLAATTVNWLLMPAVQDGIGLEIQSMMRDHLFEKA